MNFETREQMLQAIATYEEVKLQWNGYAQVQMPLWRKAYAQLFGREPTSAGCSSCVQRDVSKMKKVADELRLRIAAEDHLMQTDNPGFTLAPNGNAIVQESEPTKPKRKKK